MSRIVDDDPPIKTGAASQAYRDNFDRIFAEEIDAANAAADKKERELDEYGYGRPPAFVAWPEDQPKRYNACTDPCDMWTGPCACGATHKDGV